MEQFDEGKILYNIPAVRLLQEQARSASLAGEDVGFEERLVALMLSEFLKYWLEILENQGV